MAVKKIYFVRHGETDGNLHEYVPSRLEPLNVNGLQQAELCAERAGSIDFEKLFASNFLRAQQTAGPIAALKKLPIIPLETIGEVEEQSSLFGLSDYDERVIQHRISRNSNVENSAWRQEDGENFSDIFQRIDSTRKFLEQETAESVLLVSHSFFMQLFAAAILTGATEPTDLWFKVGCCLKVSNTGITLFTVDTDKWRLVMWNDHAHFAE